MLVSFLENLLLGFAISAVPGAVFLETIRRSILEYSSIFQFQAGNFSGMIVLIVASYLGVATLTSNETFSAIFYLVSGALLLYMGFTAFFLNAKHIKTTRSKSQATRRGAYLTGLTLAIANPLSILFWISLTGRFLEEHSYNGAVINSGVVVVGAVGLFVMIIVITRILGMKLKDIHLVRLSKLFGCIIAAYGIIALQSAIRVFWF